MDESAVEIISVQLKFGLNEEMEDNLSLVIMKICI